MNRKMKDSELVWIGEIPESWSVSKFKQILLRNDGGVWGEEPDGIDDKIVLRSTEQMVDGTLCIVDPAVRKISMKEFEGSVLKEGDILLTKSSGSISHIGKSSYITKEVEDMQCCYSNFMQRIRVSSECPKFYYYVMNNILVKEQFNYLSTTTTGLNNINSKMINNLFIVIPPKVEQERIVNYLDEKIDLIDESIFKLRSTINEYSNYKQCLITEVVTKGLNKCINMKNSNIEWIGEIPEHWKTMKIKWIMRNKSVKNHPDERVLSLYRDFGVVPKDSRDDNYNVTSENTETYKLVDVNDFVINKMKAWQGSMAISNYRGIVSPAYYVCEIYNKEIFGKYLHYLLRNQLYIPEFRRLSTGMRIGQWDLNINDFMNIEIIIPSIKEQQEIVEYLDKKCVEIDKLIDKKEQLILELENYKKSLIYECVTGKKEIEI